MDNSGQKYNMTKEGLQELKTEFKVKAEVKRPKLKAMIEDMRERGDLSENDGYTLALEDNESNERRLAELSDLIENAVIIQIKKGTQDTVCLGCNTTIEIEGKEITYNLVGPSETNPLENKLSAETPIGRAILGKKVGTICHVDLPIGKETIIIKKIS